MLSELLVKTGKINPKLKETRIHWADKGDQAGAQPTPVVEQVWFLLIQSVCMSVYPFIQLVSRLVIQSIRESLGKWTSQAVSR